MPGQPEIERRFIITPKREALQAARKRLIEQCYLACDELSDTHVRIRIEDGQKATMTRKIGTGIERREDTKDIDLTTARWLMDTTHYRLQKTRYTIPDPKGGIWEIDEFMGPYKGLVLAEKELPNRDAPAILPIEIGIIQKEVTESLSNLHLAMAAPELETDGATGLLHSPERLPCAVISGGPGAGKSELMKRIAKLFENKIHCVPETASILIHQVQVKPFGGDERKAVNFQVATARVQQQFERASHFEARVDGAKMLVLDRGIMDGAAYMPGGVFRFEKLLNTSRASIYARYDLVIYLGMPPEPLYEQIMGSNPARYEKYNDGRLVGERLAEVWSGHHNFLFLPHEGGEEGYVTKSDLGVQAVSNLLKDLQ